MFKREDRYTPEGQAAILVDHAENPRNRGLLRGVPFIGVRDLEGSAHLKMQVLFEDGRFTSVRWDGEGPRVFRAACSLVCEWVEGRTWDEYQQMVALWNDKLVAGIEVVRKTSFVSDLRALEYVVRLRPEQIRQLELPWQSIARLTESVPRALAAADATEEAAG